jgi:hypothetical protein
MSANACKCYFAAHVKVFLPYSFGSWLHNVHDNGIYKLGTCEQKLRIVHKPVLTVLQERHNYIDI